MFYCLRSSREPFPSGAEGVFDLIHKFGVHGLRTPMVLVTVQYKRSLLDKETVLRYCPKAKLVAFISNTGTRICGRNDL